MPSAVRGDAGRLFQTFSQADASTSRTYGGTGLGLAIAKGLAELMGGRVGFANRPQGGSIFWAELPLPSAEVATAPVASESRAPGPAPKRARVLLAEDNPTNQLVGSLFLKRAGCVVTAAADGLRAVDAFLSGRVRPRPHGLRDAGVPAARRVPIIALTANVLQDIRDRCRDAGMDDYLAKPIDPAALAAILQRWLSRYGRATAHTTSATATPATASAA